MEKDESTGIYLYGIVNARNPDNLGAIGIDNKPVLLVPYNDISAIVHRCTAEPYVTEDMEKAKVWILSHQYVLDLASARYRSVIPITFDTIIKGDEKIVQNWLKEKHDELKKILLSLNGRAEYGVQIFLEKHYIQKLVEPDVKLSSKINSLQESEEGVAYLLRKKMERDERAKRDDTIQSFSKDLFKEIKSIVSEVKVEETRRTTDDPWKDMMMVLNLSCLLTEEEVKHLGKLLSKLNQEDGVNIRFTGPWPPYSFVTGILE